MHIGLLDVKLELMSKSRGFTLIELLITISIIAILSAIGLVIYSSVIKQGRDSKRQSDLRSVQSALEQYYADQLGYPATMTFSTSVQLSAGGKTYLNNMPVDPISDPNYAYIASNCNPNCTSYCLYAKLEKSTPGLGNCSANGPNYNFAVSPP